jgi:DNA-binding Lrp family transcriptional regulator
MMKMDEKDRLIVRLLREDARMPVSELSKRVGLSGPSTGDRMRRLEANGIISRFTVDLDLEALGYPLQAIVRITGEDCFVTRLVLRSHLGPGRDQYRHLIAVAQPYPDMMSPVRRPLSRVETFFRDGLSTNCRLQRPC